MSNRVREELDAQGKTQKWLAEETGMAESQISHICNGSGCRVRTATKIAAVLGVAVEDLFETETEAA